ncbi:MAG: hypothetical protein ACWA47_01535 [Brevirhabdus sp.]
MKKIALAAAITMTATAVFAGGMAEPMIEPEVIETATSSSSGGLLIPLLLIAVAAAAASS